MKKRLYKRYSYNPIKQKRLYEKVYVLYNNNSI